MLLVGMLALAAHAGEGCGYIVSGFAVETRTDAPTDAELLVEATFAPIVTVVDGPNGAEPLDSELLTSCDTTGVSMAKVSPPASGWEPKATYTVESQPGHDDEGGPISFTFTTSDVPSALPDDPTIVSVSASDWSEDSKYPWGCCKPTRQVTITVEAASRDPWAYVQLKGDFEGPSQITTQPVFQRLNVGIGPGTHDLTAIQWKDDDDTLEPWAFEVAQVEANGVMGNSQHVEIDAIGAVDIGDSIDCCKKDHGPNLGCAAAPTAASIFAALAALAMARRRSR